MAKSRKNKQTTPTQPPSPVQPLDSTPPAGAPDEISGSLNSAPISDTSDQSDQEDLQTQLDEANARAAAEKEAREAAEKRAAVAEEQVKSAEDSLAAEEVPVPVTQAGPKRFNDDGNELCWNCINNNIETPLQGGRLCDVCGFDKDKLYNGNIEAEKAGQRALADQGY